MNCPRGHGALRWDGEDTTCIVCGYVHYTVEDQTKLRYQLWLDEIRSETAKAHRSHAKGFTVTCCAVLTVLEEAESAQ